MTSRPARTVGKLRPGNRRVHMARCASSSPRDTIAVRSLRASRVGRLCTTVRRTARTSSMSGQHAHSPHESGRSHRAAFGLRRYSRQYSSASLAWPGHRRVTSRRASSARPRGDRPGRFETLPGPVVPSARRACMSTWTSVRDLRGIVPLGSHHAAQLGTRPGWAASSSFRVQLGDTFALDGDKSVRVQSLLLSDSD